MDNPSLIAMFLVVFLAELGDKTQLATLFFASEGNRSPWIVFIIASLALVTSTGIAVLLGTVASKYIAVIPLKLVSGIGFVLIGSWTILEYIRG